ncbi:MAG: C10 family peptidase [Bacteroidales bacterium]|nr:C10 family peptidase [Bacteroidales bacterium]
MRKIYLTLVSIALCGLTFAQSVTQQEAAAVAQRFLESQGKTLEGCAKTFGDAQNPTLYIFNAENGFVVISGDKNVTPVLSFSDQQRYNDSDVVPPFEMWINHYANQIEQIRREQISQPQYVDYWNRILANAPAFRTGDEVEPLMLSQWDQGEFYNYYCPRDLAGDNGRVVTGCVATAMAQLIYYYRFPETGIGSYSYTDEHYGVQSADYGNTTYDYNAMCDKPSCINTEISKLIYHCGVGVDMHYGPDGSGMQNHSAARVLRTYFKYSPETEYLFRDSTDLNWDSVIVSHLNRRMPLYYAGWSVPDINGHGFICDGYKTMDSSYYFHFNFGWSGYMDNYYYTNSLFVGSSNFNLAQELIINAYPDTTQYAYPTPQPLTGSLTLTAREGTFTDGSQTDALCPDNMNFTWNIQPDSYFLQEIGLSIDYCLNEGDTLFIWSCTGMGLPLVITADTGNFNMTFACPSLAVQIVTHSAASNGFRAHYTTHYSEFCSGTQMFTNATGNITDGSGDLEYSNFSNCRFRIMLNNSYSAIGFHINSLDLEEGHDYLSFYDNTVSAANHLLTLTGHISDSDFVLNTRRLTLVLETDESGRNAGFDIDYAAGYVGIDQHTADGLRVYPNPVTDHVTIDSPGPVSLVEVLNAEGRLIYTDNPGNEHFEISTAGWSAGVYFLTARTGDQLLTRKIVKW